MKILLAAHHTPPTYNGGVEWVTLHGARWLKNQGHEVEIVSVEHIQPGLEKITSKQDVFKEITIHRLSIPVSLEENQFEESYWNESIKQWFSNCFDNHQPDVFHLHSGYLLTLSPFQAAFAHGIPTVLSLHDYWTVCPRINLLHPNMERCSGPQQTRCAWCLMAEKRRFRWLYKILGSEGRQLVGIPFATKLIGLDRVVNKVQQRQKTMNDQLKKVDVIMALSSMTQQLVLKQGVDQQKVVFAPNGVDTSRWIKPLPGKIPANKLRIGYLGNIAPIKGIHLLIEAFRLLMFEGKEAELRIYGDINKSPAYARQLRWLAGADGRILFLGAYDHDRLPELFQQIDLLVIPSLWNEIGPLVTLESFACLTPVVVSNIPNMINQISEGVNGLSFEAGNVQSLANVLQRFIFEPGLLSHLTYGIQPIRSHDDQMQDWLMCYQKALEMHS